MLPRRRVGSLRLLRLLLVLVVAFAAVVAFCPAAAAAAGEGVGVVEEEEVRVGEAAAAVARGEGDDAVVAAAVAGGEVAGEAGAGLGEGAAAANATGKEGSLAEMIDRALEKEFPESEGEQGGGGALDLVTSGGGGGGCPVIRLGIWLLPLGASGSAASRSRPPWPRRWGILGLFGTAILCLLVSAALVFCREGPRQLQQHGG